jgi:hypothetical protein
MQELDNSPRDLSKTRTLTLQGGNAINITSTDPFGFWYISWERGQLPEYLRGAYTSASEAEKAVNVYLAEKGKDVKQATK